MNFYLVLAAILSVLVGFVHSVLGEVLIFQKLRKGKLVPTLPATPLQSRNVRILWATWHLASVLGWVVAAILFRLATQTDPDLFVIHTLAMGMLLSGILVCYATQAKHPGWLGLSAVALCCWLAI